MASDDRNEEVDNLVVTDSITDPSGILHSGELADIDDTGSGGSVDSSVVTGPISAVEVADSPYSASAGEIIAVNTSGGDVTVVLPSSPSGGEAVEVFVVNDTNSVIVDSGSNNLESDSSTIDNNDVRLYRFHDNWWRAHGGDRNDFSGRALIDPSGKTIGTTDSIATEDQLGSGSAGEVVELGPYGVMLVGNDHSEAPATGLMSTMQNEYDNNGKVFFNVTGRWEASSTFNYSSSNGTPDYTGPNGKTYDMPLMIDFKGAIIEHTGTGYAMVDDSRPDTTGGTNLNGGVSRIVGGQWVSDGTNPDGIWLGRDTGGQHIEFDQVKNYQSGNDNIIEVRSEETWCESNYVQVHFARFCDTVYYFNDTGQAASSDGNNVSFQDNKVGFTRAGRVTNGNEVLNLNGNFVDCWVEGIVGIAGSDGSCAVHHNTNASGTYVGTLIWEQGAGGGSGYANSAVVRIGNDPRGGPVQYGGGPGADGTDWFHDPNNEGGWTWYFIGTDGAGATFGSAGMWMVSFGGSGQETAIHLDGGGMKIGNFPNGRNSNPVANLQIDPSGNIDATGTISGSQTGISF